MANLVAPERRKRMVWRLAGIPLHVSAIDVDDARLWGLSLMMVDELARAAGLKVPAP
jgi:hypothetical protein